MMNRYEAEGFAHYQRKLANKAWGPIFLAGHKQLPGVTIAADLTMKQGDGVDRLDTELAARNLRHCLNLVNREYFGPNFRRKNKGIFVAPALERSFGLNHFDVSGRLHYHLLLKPPSVAASSEEFRLIFLGAWLSTKWAHKEFKWNENIDSERASYGAKFWTVDCQVDHLNLNWPSSSFR